MIETLFGHTGTQYSATKYLSASTELRNKLDGAYTSFWKVVLFYNFVFFVSFVGYVSEMISHGRYLIKYYTLVLRIAVMFENFAAACHIEIIAC